MSKRKKQDRTIVTPGISTDLAETGEKLVFWKQILPEDTINYTDESGQTRVINFDRNYHQDCIDSFRKRAVDQTCFQLATPTNSHGRDFDPERQRAEVLDMATLDQLPPEIQAKVEHKPGLYAKMKFWDKRAARSVLQNPKLGVSARVRENFTRVDGTRIKRAVIHVLGTIDPRITGMSAWQAADFSYDPKDGFVLDLSSNHYQGDQMPKAPKSKKRSADDLPSAADIEAMNDEELTAFLDELEADDDLEDDADTSDEDEDEDDDDLEDDEDEDEDDNTGAQSGTRQLTGASLSNKARNAISLANENAAEANRRAYQALRNQAKAEFKALRVELLAAGVPADKIDLAQPVLERADPLVIDLSNSGEEDLDVTAVVLELLDGYKGTVDMSNEAGHSGTVNVAGGDDDPDAEALAAWEAQFPTGMIVSTD